MSDERKRRWRDDARILQIVTAPPGWWALYAKDARDIEPHPRDIRLRR
jgi:hypothetical protein